MSDPDAIVSVMKNKSSSLFYISAHIYTSVPSYHRIIFAINVDIICNYLYSIMYHVGDNRGIIVIS